MVARDNGVDLMMDSGDGLVELQTYKQMDWKELGERPLSTLTRVFGQDYLMSNIGARPDQATFIELDQIHNFTHLMIEYALANRIVGPLNMLDQETQKPFPAELKMSIQKPPDRLMRHAKNLATSQDIIDAEETTLSMLLYGKTEALKPYAIQLDELEKTLKKNSPESKTNVAPENLPPTLVENVIGNIYRGIHAPKNSGTDDYDLDQAIGTSWELVNKRIAELHVLSPDALREDRVSYDKGLVDKYREEHAGYQAELVNSGELRQQRNSDRQESEERRKRELAELSQSKLEQDEAYEKGIKIRAGLLFPDMPESDRRTDVYKKSLLATQTMLLTDFILKADLNHGNQLIDAFERSTNHKLIEQTSEVEDEPIEPSLQAGKRRKALAEFLYSQVTSRNQNSQGLLQQFAESASLEYENIMANGYEQNDRTREIEKIVNTNLTLDQLSSNELSKLEIEAKIFVEY